jgi:hypothetical protein
MTDVSITDNIAADSSYDLGGGLCNTEGTVIMTGVSITDNIADYGGGLCNNRGTVTMTGGSIAGNSADYGAGVHLWNDDGMIFIKQGGVIYGDTDTDHTAGSDENTATGDGHAVYLNNGNVRNTTAGEGVNLYARYQSGSWSYVDPDASAGGLGDTTAAWPD